MKLFKKKKRIWLIALMAAVLLAVILFLCRNELSPDSIRMRLKGLFSVGVADEYIYDGGTNAQIRLMDGSLAVATGTGLGMHDRNGELTYTCGMELDSPAMEQCGRYGLLYDIGGTSAVLFSSDKVLLQQQADNKIISASVNKNGWYVLCTAETAYTSSATVYRPDGAAVYKWYCADGYVSGAVLDDRNSTLAVSAYDTGGSAVLTFALDQTEELSRTLIENGLVLRIWWTGENTFTVLTRDGLYFFRDGEIENTVLTELTYLTGFARAERCTILAGCAYEGGSCTLKVISDGGEELGSIVLPSAPNAMNAEGNIVAVLCGSSVMVYNTHMQQLAAYVGAGDAKRVFALADATVLCAGDYYAWHLKTPVKAESKSIWH